LPHDAHDFTFDYNGNVAKLSINRVYPEDEGEYTCIATNNIGRAFTSACIVVDVPEEKENHLSRQLAKPPGFTNSTCSTPRSTPRSTPIRSISPMPLSYRATHIDIEKNKKKHKTMAPKFLSIPHNRVAEEGETIRFQCTLAGHPLPWSTWDKNGTVVTPTARINIKEKDDCRILEIEEVTHEDAGLYRITLENDFGRIEATARLDVIGHKGSSTRMVRTLSSSPRRNLYYSKRLMGNSTKIGGRLSLSCAFRGSSTPAKKYYHNGCEVMEDERIKIESEFDQVFLLIDNARVSDEGEYTCIAETDSGIISTSANIFIYENEEDIPKTKPAILAHLESKVQTKEGVLIDLVCQVDCNFPYSFVWKKGNDIVQDSKDFE
jgi:myosin-light-chain kinase